MLQPMKAIVRPRVIVQQTQDAVLLEDLVEDLLASPEGGRIHLYGSAASGISTALNHVASVCRSDWGPVVHDWERPATEFDELPSGAIVVTKSSTQSNQKILKCRIAGWGRDEWIEYLLAAHPSQCASVMRRLRDDAAIGRLGDKLDLLRKVLDELALDDQLPDCLSTLQRLVERNFPTREVRLAVARPMLFAAGEVKRPVELSVAQERLISAADVRFLLTVEAAWDELERVNSLRPIAEVWPWPRRLMSAVVHKLTDSPRLQEKLRGRIQDPLVLPLSISLLHAAQSPTEPLSKLWQAKVVCENLSEAVLDHADCRGMMFSDCTMIGASFQNANLAKVDLKSVNASSANFSGADLRRVRLNQFVGINARFIRTDLSDSIGNRAQFNDADFSFAHMKNAHFRRCNFSRANLSNAVLTHAALPDCKFTGVCLDEADFRYADLTRAQLCNLNLTVARFQHAVFHTAQMGGCNLEQMELPDAVFESAYLNHAVMTDSIMPGANFENARLCGAKLAGVEWESVNLRGANLSGATFHMGSSRSGLVGSPIASEGSRTGFYTDEYNEQDFKSPEEIRRANLRGADLRDANIGSVDFYLVDLRDAIYDAKQAEHFRQTGAILVSRIC